MASQGWSERTPKSKRVKAVTAAKSRPMVMKWPHMQISHEIETQDIKPTCTKVPQDIEMCAVVSVTRTLTEDAWGAVGCGAGPAWKRLICLAHLMGLDQIGIRGVFRSGLWPWALGLLAPVHSGQW